MLNPCSECGANKRILVRCGHEFQVRCFICSTKTKPYATEAEAKDAWQKEILCTHTKNAKKEKPKGA
jgi:hypothetical protein